MSLRIGDEAPNFQAQTTEGPIDFHTWIGDSYAILFSHPKDFTPVCTTELGYVARIKSEFDRRGAKVIGLSVDPVDDHKVWAKDIEETQGAALNYPLIGDHDLKVSKLYDMLPATAGDSSQARTAADNLTVRTVFVVGPDKKIKTMLYLSDDHRAQLRRGAARAGLHPAHDQAQGGHTGQLEAGPGRHHRRIGERRGGEKAVPRRLEGAEALICGSCPSQSRKPRARVGARAENERSRSRSLANGRRVVKQEGR